MLKRILSFVSLAIVSIVFYMGCSSNDEPEPVDCDDSDLALSVDNQQDVSNCAASDGIIAVSATGGEEPYEFKLDNGSYQASGTFNNVGAGTHIVTVKDNNGCEVDEANIEIGITGSNLSAGTPSITTDSECLTDNGSIMITPTGGTEPYEFKLNSGSFSAPAASITYFDLEEGNYVITIRDAATCTITVNVNVPHGDTGVTYTADILPIFQAKCQFAGCHPDNGDWFTYNTAKNNAAAIKTRTGNGSMPKSPQPGGALTADQKALIACWVDDGAPQ